MVLKLETVIVEVKKGFESSVNSDGTQTLDSSFLVRMSFESSVNSDGTQT